MRLIRQKADYDCAVAALNMLLPTVAYGTIREAVAVVEPRWCGRKGLYNREVLTVAARLGLALEPTRRRASLDTATGVLRVYWQHRSRRAMANPGGHMVVVHRARILDPGLGCDLPWPTYVAVHGARLGTLLARR